jgi:hypothetical protein
MRRDGLGMSEERYYSDLAGISGPCTSSPWPYWNSKSERHCRLEAIGPGPEEKQDNAETPAVFASRLPPTAPRLRRQAANPL